jgi:hypothetical protein
LWIERFAPGAFCPASFPGNRRAGRVLLFPNRRFRGRAENAAGAGFSVCPKGAAEFTALRQILPGGSAGFALHLIQKKTAPLARRRFSLCF